MGRSTPQKHVVIVGGGFAGIRCSLLLQQAFKITLVDAKDYYEYTPSNLRCLIHPDHLKRTIVPHRPDVLQGIVTAVSALPGSHGGQITLQSGDTLDFDYCLLCLGSTYAAPIKPLIPAQAHLPDRFAQFEAAHQQLAAAKHIVIIGGGAVGVELAAEIVGRWNKGQKQVTLVTSKDRVLERMAQAASMAALRTEVVLQTDQGRTLVADLVYDCVGVKPCGIVFDPPLAGHQRSELTAPIPVEPTLQVCGLQTLLALGDCCNTDEEKCAFTAELDAMLAAENICRLDDGRPLLTYPQGVCGGAAQPPTMAVISLYKHTAILQMRGLVLTGRLPAFMKQMVEYLMVQSARGSWVHDIFWMGLKRAMLALLRLWGH
ncbi:hypothetical protein WJX72_009838 [[Myrmecia] bisecta]|uniref:FAD/NAD(P)-binding domain-containing protein n=1 Tax=[Myrmecia] bisecta TaxID=41462 RepID=A0AAW1PQ64_9CHLO